MLAGLKLEHLRFSQKYRSNTLILFKLVFFIRKAYNGQIILIILLHFLLKKLDHTHQRLVSMMY